ncbi:hypothetical protein [Thermaerobacillus caldiproteolyticus]
MIPKFSHMKLEQIKPVMITKYYHSLINEGLSEEYAEYHPSR